MSDPAEVLRELITAASWATKEEQGAGIAILDRLIARLHAAEEERNGLRQMIPAMAAARFSEREWRDKAQDKIAEVEALEAELDRLRDVVTAARRVARFTDEAASGSPMSTLIVALAALSSTQEEK